MKFLAGSFAAISLLMASPLIGAEWQAFLSESGQFKALFPVEPVASARKLPAGTGEIDYHSFVAVTAKGSVVYSISYSEYPSDIPAVDRQRFLASARDATLRGLDGKLAADTEMQVQGHAGREFTIVAVSEKRPVLFHSRSFVAGRRMYQLQIVRMGNTPLDLADAIRFFAHFQLEGSRFDTAGGEPKESDLLRESRAPKGEAQK